MKIGKIELSAGVNANMIAAVVASICAIAVLTLPTAVLAQSQDNMTTSSAPTNANNSVSLGTPFNEGKGMVTGQRVLEVSPMPKIETSFFENDTFKGGITASDSGTYTSVIKNDGSIYGEGQGIITTKDGEIATWKGQGVGQFMPDGTIRFHGSLFFDTSSAGKLSFLKNMVGVFDYQVDPTGKTMSKVWEWK